MFIDDITVRVASKVIDLRPKAEVTHRFLLYHGPVKPSLLGHLAGEGSVSADLVDRYAHTLSLNTMVDYPSPGWLPNFAYNIGFTRLIILATNAMHSILWAIHQVIPSYGLCIILLTVFVRGMMFPVSRNQAMTSIKMQQLAPELKKLQEKFKDDRQAMATAQWDLYKRHKVRPLANCWMLLIQMPIYMGLYYAFQESISFRMVPFWPLWIQNLAAPDMLLYWGESIPIISTPDSYGGILYLGPYLNLLPFIAITLTILQQQMMTPPAMDEQQEMNYKMMKYMTLFFGLMFYRVAAGLCIYFIASSVWAFTERQLLPKKKPVTPGPDGGSTTTILPAESSVNGKSDETKRSPGKKGRTKRRRDDGRGKIGEGTKTGTGSSGGWFGGLREWWEEVLRNAEKKR